MQENHKTTTDGASKTAAPVATPAVAAYKPEFIRLPAPGRACPWTGLKRSKLNELILPSEGNEFRPPVKSVRLRNRGQVKAVRLIVYQSLLDYLYGLEGK